MVEINLLPWRDNSKEKRWRILFIVSMIFSFILSWLIYQWMQHSLQEAHSTIDFLRAELKEKSDKQPVRQRHASIAAKIPVQQLKLAGYIEKKDFFWVLIMLPNGETHEIQKGSVIGKENGLVLKINKNEIVIQLESGEYLHIPNTDHF